MSFSSAQSPHPQGRKALKFLPAGDSDIMKHQMRVLVLQLYAQCSMVSRLNVFMGLTCSCLPKQTFLQRVIRETENVPWAKSFSFCRPVRLTAAHLTDSLHIYPWHTTANAAHKITNHTFTYWVQKCWNVLFPLREIIQTRGKDVVKINLWY